MITFAVCVVAIWLIVVYSVGSEYRDWQKERERRLKILEDRWQNTRPNNDQEP